MPVPTHLQPYIHADSLHSFDGIKYRFAIAHNGSNRFYIRYYGEFYDDLITDTDNAPAKVVGDEHSEDSLNNRPLQDLDDTLYQIEVHAFYNIDYEAEREDFCDENGKIELINSEIIDFDRLRQDGMDAIVIELIDPQGRRREIVREELA